MLEFQSRIFDFSKIGRVESVEFINNHNLIKLSLDSRLHLIDSERGKLDFSLWKSDPSRSGRPGKKKKTKHGTPSFSIVPETRLNRKVVFF